MDKIIITLALFAGLALAGCVATCIYTQIILSKAYEFFSVDDEQSE